MNYLLLPGNPPAIHFYQLWQNEITTLQPNFKTKVSSYPLLLKTKNSNQAMETVYLAHLEQLQNFYHETSEPINLIGHSLGGYFAMRLLEQANPAWIHQVVLLHPFLRKPNSMGKFILNSVATLQRYEILQKTVVKNRKFLEFFSSELPHVTDEEIFKTFHLGLHESRTIARDQSPIHVRSDLRDKVQVFYHPHDTWCQPHVINQLAQQIKVHECHEPHGFVTEEKYRRSLFEKIRSLHQ